MKIEIKNKCPLCGGMPKVQSIWSPTDQHHLGEVHRIYCTMCGVTTKTLPDRVGEFDDEIPVDELLNLWDSKMFATSPIGQLIIIRLRKPL